MILALECSSTISRGRLARTAGALLALLLASTALAGAASASETGQPAWEPRVVERLVKLPGTHLKRAIDNDFAGSQLGGALVDTEGQIGGKLKSMAELQKAVERAEGEVRTELRHQFLAEKKDYIKLVGARLDLKRRQLKTSQRLYDALLKRMDQTGAGATPEQISVAAKQEEARRRFEKSLAEVDTRLFAADAARETKYGREHAKNMAAVEQLVQAIRQHPMSAGPELDGQPVSKQDYVRSLQAQTDADLALVDQEELILGHMAKLVALDAMALSEEIDAPESVADPDNRPGDVTRAVGLFITR